MTPRVDVWPPLPPHGALRRVESVPFPLDEPGARLLARAGHGIGLGARALGLGSGDEVLVPAYHHGLEVQALLDAGTEIRFYEGTDSLAPDADELERLCTRRTRALYLIHYLGFPQDAPSWRRWCDERDLLLIEDAAQAWLAWTHGRPVGTWGDLAVFCLYETVGTPGGAVVRLARADARAVLDRSLATVGASRREAIAGLAGGQAAWLASRSGVVGALVARAGSDAPRPPGQELALGAPALAPQGTATLACRLAADAAARRRAHYGLLLTAVGERVPAPFDDLPAGASPFALPIAVSDSERVLGSLARAGVRAMSLWPYPHPSLPAERFPRAGRRRAETIALPVHQELRPRHIEQIGRVLAPRRTIGPPWRLQVHDDLEDLREDWDELALRSRSIFATWEWNALWWRRHGRGRRLAVVSCRDARGRCRAIVPLFTWRRSPVRVARFIAHSTADELQPIAAPEDRVRVAQVLRHALALIGCDVLLADHLPRGHGWSALGGGGRVLRREGFPVVRWHGSWDDYVESRDGGLAGQLRRRARQLERRHRVTYRLADDAAALPADLDALFGLHAARWPDGSGFSSHEGFHRDFATRALDRGWLRLWLLELDGHPVAALYGLSFAGRELFYQSGRDRALDRLSVGTLLFAHAVRAGLAASGEYELLRGSEPYKYRWATEDRGVETVAFPRDVRGHAALAAASLVDAALPARAVRAVAR